MTGSAPARAHVLAAFPGRGVAVDLGADGLDLLNAHPPVPAGATLTAAAVLVPLVEHRAGMTVLLTRRTDHLNAHSGQISFPGGRVEPDDHSPEATALRETLEEIGLIEDHIELVGRLAVRETGTGFRVVPVVGLVRPPFALAPDPNEVAEVFEVPLDFALDPANHRVETRMLRGAERKFYSIAYGDYYIWGLTARLIVNLSTALRRR